MQKFSSVDEYIHSFPADIQTVLNDVRALVRSVAPDASEQIAYGMPAYKLRGKPLVYFGAYKGHLGVYALPVTHTEYAVELAPYVHSKGSVQFSWSKPIPYDLIKRMVVFRKKELET